MRKHVRTVNIFMMLAFVVCVLVRAAESRDLKASLPVIPGTDVTRGNAVFIDLVKMIDDVYTEGTIRIEIYPFTRSIKNVERGKADFRNLFGHSAFGFSSWCRHV